MNEKAASRMYVYEPARQTTNEMHVARRHDRIGRDRQVDTRGYSGDRREIAHDYEYSKGGGRRSRRPERPQEVASPPVQYQTVFDSRFPWYHEIEEIRDDTEERRELSHERNDQCRRRQIKRNPVRDCGEEEEDGGYSVSYDNYAMYLHDNYGDELHNGGASRTGKQSHGRRCRVPSTIVVRDKLSRAEFFTNCIGARSSKKEHGSSRPSDDKKPSEPSASTKTRSSKSKNGRASLARMNCLAGSNAGNGLNYDERCYQDEQEYARRSKQTCEKESRLRHNHNHGSSSSSVSPKKRPQARTASSKKLIERPTHRSGEAILMREPTSSNMSPTSAPQTLSGKGHIGFPSSPPQQSPPLPPPQPAPPERTRQPRTTSTVSVTTNKKRHANVPTAGGGRKQAPAATSAMDIVPGERTFLSFVDTYLDRNGFG